MEKAHTGKKVSIAGAVLFGFYTTLEHLALMLSLFCIYALSLFIVLVGLLIVIWLLFRTSPNGIIYVVGYPNLLAGDGIIILGIALTVIFIPAFVYYLLSVGKTQIALNLYDYHNSSLKALFSGKKFVLRAMIGSLLYTIITILGYAFFIIPGVYLSLRFGFYQQVLVDQNLGILDAFKESWRLSHGAVIELWGLSIIMGILYAITIPTIFGLLIAVPLALLAKTYAYRKLLAHNSLQL